MMSGLSFRPEGEYASALESERPDSNDFSKKYKFSFMDEINISISREARPSVRYAFLLLFAFLPQIEYENH